MMKYKFDALIGLLEKSDILNDSPKVSVITTPPIPDLSDYEYDTHIKELDKIDKLFENGSITFEKYHYFLQEALTNAMKSLMMKYPELTEEEMEKWAAVDPSGQKAINLPAMLKLRKENKIKGPADIKKIIRSTTYVPEKIEVTVTGDPGHERRKSEEVPRSAEETNKFIQANANQSLPWVLNQIKNNQIIYPEDLPSVKSTLHIFYKFNKSKHWPQGASTDLHSYSTISKLTEVTSDILVRLYAGDMEKKLPEKPDTKVLAIDPPYELIRIFPTRRGQLSLHEYTLIGGRRYAQWCTGYSPESSGWSNFCNYLRLEEVPGYEDISRNKAKNMPQEIIDNPLYSHYLVGKEGKPFMLFEFQKNFYMNIGDHEGRDDPSYPQIRKMIEDHIPGARKIVAPSNVRELPTVSLKRYIKQRPGELARIVICRLRHMEQKAGTKQLERLNTPQKVQEFAMSTITALNTRMPDAFKKRDINQNSGLGIWIKYAQSDAEKTDQKLSEPINFNTPQFIQQLTRGLNDKNCEGGIDYDQSMERILLSKIEEVRREGLMANDEVTTEGVLGRALGTAALAGTLMAGTADATPKGKLVNSIETRQSKYQARGLRNNNPGNLKISDIKWKGKIGDDGTFIKFNTMENGVRAMARLLRNYNRRYHLNTIDGIIKRWAPPSDRNPTEKYIKFVSERIGIPSNQKLNLENDARVFSIITAIIKFETGKELLGKVVIDGIRAERVK